MSEKKIAILDMYNGLPNQGMQALIKILQNLPYRLSWDFFDVRGQARVPDLNYDIYISTGGSGSPMMADEIWNHRWNAFIDQILFHNRENTHSKKHLFLICHSFQMAVDYWKLADVRKMKKGVFGLFPVYKTVPGMKDPLLKKLPDPFFVADSRDWQVINPDEAALESMGAELLCMEHKPGASDDDRAVMGIRFSPEISGVQFHPEANATDMEIYLKSEQKKSEIISKHGYEAYMAMMDAIHEAGNIQRTCQTVIPGFISRILSEPVSTFKD